uniref:Uncharacterized protein n=1 Tax=Octopus bimaculoides TaxID=37653 RepID=A0A0L8G4M8_OCTBM
MPSISLSNFFQSKKPLLQQLVRVIYSLLTEHYYYQNQHHYYYSYFLKLKVCKNEDSFLSSIIRYAIPLNHHYRQRMEGTLNFIITQTVET